MKKLSLNILTFFVLFFTFSGGVNAQIGEGGFFCGSHWEVGAPEIAQCDCGNTTEFSQGGQTRICCGWVNGNGCFPTDGLNGDPGAINIDDVSNETFDALNPLKLAESPLADKLSTPGGILSRLLTFLFPIAGLILFVMIVWGGFEILLKASDSKGLESGKNRITAAIVGFLLLFSSYWIVQIIEVIFGLKIL